MRNLRVQFVGNKDSLWNSTECNQDFTQVIIWDDNVKEMIARFSGMNAKLDAGNFMHIFYTDQITKEKSY